MFGAERFFPDVEGAAVQRLRLAVAALVIVERRQVVEAGGGVRMFGAARFFPDGEGAAVQRFGLAVLRALAEIVATLAEKTDCRRGAQSEVLHQAGRHSCMRE